MKNNAWPYQQIDLGPAAALSLSLWISFFIFLIYHEKLRGMLSGSRSFMQS